MLILRRKVGEGITIKVPANIPNETEIRIIILDRSHAQVTLGYKCNEDTVKVLVRDKALREDEIEEIRVIPHS